MRRIYILIFLALAMTVCFSNQSFAKNNDDKSTMSESQIKRRVLEAEATDKRLIVKLKNGKSVSGDIEWVSNKEFRVIHPDNSILISRGEEIINFDDVAYVKGRNPFVKTLKKIGEYTSKTAAIIAISPYLAFLYSYSYLVFGEPPPDC